MANVKLYYFPGACSLASHILLNEAGVQFEGVKVTPPFFRSEEFRRLNPKLKVPVLVVDDEVITENPAIMTAISQLVPEQHLMGTTNLEIVRVYEWLNWLTGTLHGQAFGGLFRPERYSDEEEAHVSIKEKGMKTVLECYDVIEEKLTSDHAVGSSFTVVDPFLYVFYRWGMSREVDMKTKYPKYSKFVANLMKRESIQKALETEGLPSYVPEL